MTNAFPYQTGLLDRGFVRVLVMGGMVMMHNLFLVMFGSRRIRRVRSQKETHCASH